MKFVSILSLLVLSAIGLAESRRRRRRGTPVPLPGLTRQDAVKLHHNNNPSNDLEEDSDSDSDEEEIEKEECENRTSCNQGLKCCSEDKSSGKGICRKTCKEDEDELDQASQRRRRYRRRY